MSFGVMGGATQPQGHAQIVINIIDFGMNIQEAGDAPRILHQGSSQPTGEEMTNGGNVYLESGLPYEVYRDLRKRGHRGCSNVGSIAGYQSIMIDWEHKGYYGASESGKDGRGAAY